MTGRELIAVGLMPAACCAAPGCTLQLDREPGQCASHADCQRLGPEYVCAADRVCVSFYVGRADPVPEPGSCQRDADCVSLGQAVCRSGSCLPLTDPDRGCIWYGMGTTTPPDGSVPLLVGLLARPDDRTSSLFERRLLGPVRTAINELNRTRETGSALPALVGVSCDVTSPDALEYLLDGLKVNLLMGSTDASGVEPLLNRIAGRAVLWAPFADGADLTLPNGPVPSLLVSCKPNRAGARGHFLPAIAQVQRLAGARLETVSPVIAVSGDVATTAFFGTFNGGDLQAAGLRSVGYTGGQQGRGLVSALESMSPYPNLIIAASAEDAWGDNMAAVDRSSYDRTLAYPYYLLSEKQGAVYSQTVSDQATADGSLPRYDRIMGLDYHRGAPSVLAQSEFNVAHRDELGLDAEPGFEYAYDCAYLATYSALAAAERFAISIFDLSPEALIGGVSALTQGGPLLPVSAATVGETIEHILENGGGPGSVDLIGTSGDLALRSVLPAESQARGREYVAPSTPDGELYCIDARSRTFCDTGVTVSVTGAVTQPDVQRCICLPEAP